jgi:hypothetical protein
MNLVELHLAINHLPVLGLPFAAALLAAGLVFDNAEWRRAGLWTAALSGAVVWIVYASGGLAADAAGGLAGISDHDVAAHAAAAWRFAWAATAAGSAAIAALVIRPPVGERPSRRATSVVLALALAASAVGGWTAHLGGRIRHPELHDAG